MAYTPITGNDGALTVGSTTVAALRNWTIEQTADTIEVTTCGNDHRKYISGLSSWTGSADIYFDAAESTGTVFALTSGTVGTSPVDAKFYVKDSATAGQDVAYTGTVVVTGYSVTSNHDGLVEASISFQGSGALNFTNLGTV